MKAVTMMRGGARVELEEVTKMAPTFSELPTHWPVADLLDAVVDVLKYVEAPDYVIAQVERAAASA